MKTLPEAISMEREIFNTEEQKIALQKSVAGLPEDQQKVISLHFTQQLPVSAISQQLKCSVTTTYLKLNRALFTLRNEFNPEAYKKMYDILYPETGKPMKL